MSETNGIQSQGAAGGPPSTYGALNLHEGTHNLGEKQCSASEAEPSSSISKATGAAPAKAAPAPKVPVLVVVLGLVAAAGLAAVLLFGLTGGADAEVGENLEIHGPVVGDLDAPLLDKSVPVLDLAGTVPVGEVDLAARREVDAAGKAVSEVDPKVDVAAVLEPTADADAEVATATSDETPVPTDIRTEKLGRWFPYRGTDKFMLKEEATKAREDLAASLKTLEEFEDKLTWGAMLSEVREATLRPWLLPGLNLPKFLGGGPVA